MLFRHSERSPIARRSVSFLPPLSPPKEGELSPPLWGGFGRGGRAAKESLLFVCHGLQIRVRREFAENTEKNTTNKKTAEKILCGFFELSIIIHFPYFYRHSEYEEVRVRDDRRLNRGNLCREQLSKD